MGVPISILIPDTAIRITWIPSEPARIQPVAATTNLERLRDICRKIFYRISTIVLVVLWPSDESL
jgi:predicted oxidoreductase